MSQPTTLTCDCEEVELSISGEPAAQAYCHCDTCRGFYDVPVLSAGAWPADNVKITKGAKKIAQFTHPTKQMKKFFCTQCGETMVGVNRLGMAVVRNSLFAKANGGVLPSTLRPTFHLFYGSRELDINDELPKYVEGWDGPLVSE